MLKMSWKGVLAHKVRLALTGLAIVLGVAFISGSFVFTDRMSSAFDDLFAGSTDGIDLIVQEGGSLGFIAGKVPEEVLDRVVAVDGVAQAIPSVQGYAQMIDKEGKPIGGTGPPTFGFSIDAAEFETSIDLVRGRPAARPGRGDDRRLHRPRQRIRGRRPGRRDLHHRRRDLRHRGDARLRRCRQHAGRHRGGARVGRGAARDGLRGRLCGDQRGRRRGSQRGAVARRRRERRRQTPTSRWCSPPTNWPSSWNRSTPCSGSSTPSWWRSGRSPCSWPPS